METSANIIDACTREIEITLTNEDLQPHYERAYREAQKQVDLPGFRKGKAPLNLVKQKFGRSIEQNSLDTIANDEFNKFVRDGNIQFIGQPSLRDIRKTPESITFIIRYEIVPEIELGEYRNLYIKKPIFTVSEDEIQKAIDDICLRFSKLEPAESAMDNMHIVHAQFTPLDDETLTPIIGAKSEASSFFLRSEEMDDNLRSLLLDSKVGDALTFVEDAADDNTLPARYRVDVLKIERVIPAEFNDELSLKFSEGKLKTTEEVREDIIKFGTLSNENRARAAMEDQVVEQLSQSHSFEVPNTVVRRIMESMLENARKQLNQPGLEKITVDDVDSEFRPRATEIARWQILSDKIAEAENIEIEDEDLAPYVDMLQAKQTKLNENQIRNYILQQEGLISEIFQRKTFNKIFEYAVVTETPEDEYYNSMDAHFHPDDNVRRYFGSQAEGLDVL